MVLIKGLLGFIEYGVLTVVQSTVVRDADSTALKVGSELGAFRESWLSH